MATSAPAGSSVSLTGHSPALVNLVIILVNLITMCDYSFHKLLLGKLSSIVNLSWQFCSIGVTYKLPCPPSRDSEQKRQQSQAHGRSETKTSSCNYHFHVSSSIKSLPNFWFKDLQRWQTGVERHLMRLEPDVKLPWQEPLWNPEQCPMMWKL